MPIHPLPQFEADLAEDRRIYEALKPPTSIVVRFGVMRMIGEFPYDGSAKPGCGSKMVVRTHRGVELGEMLTSTCPNAGCSKSVTRKEMLEYIENSGGRDYPFFNQGRVLRVATPEDLALQARHDSTRQDLLNQARNAAKELNLRLKIVEVETILGGDRVTFYYGSEDRVDFRELVTRLAGVCKARIEMRQIGARDEARLVADYERCGQHCCCRQFLKVLKPVSMRSAKVQKATLDPLKISGRCGRLMCCLRYEDQTYTELQKRLPKKKWRVESVDGPGIVLDTQILTQLVLVKLDRDGTESAYPLEELTVLGPGGGSGGGGGGGGGGGAREARRPGGPPPADPGRRDRSAPGPTPRPDDVESDDQVDDEIEDQAENPDRRGPSGSGSAPAGGAGPRPSEPGGPQGADQPGGGGKRRRRRRRRRRPDGDGSGGGPPGGQGDGPSGAPPSA
ncbi:MAG: hypothetical protein KF745_12230 [Phycisphaeraceae bacterium]|nr:hypothetical protein [Phycisphaeraceae bacterium]